MRLTSGLSAALICSMPRSWRLRLGVFLVKIWLVKDCLCLKPWAVFLNRFAAALQDFIFGIEITRRIYI